MILEVKRAPPSDGYMEGGLFVDGKKFCETLEDLPREVKIPKATAIPSGKYEIVVSWSNRFKKQMILLLEVPGYTGVRIHAGVTSEDTEGCILIGFKSSPGKLRDGVKLNADLTKRVSEACRQGKVHIHIT